MNKESILLMTKAVKVSELKARNNVNNYPQIHMMMIIIIMMVKKSAVFAVEPQLETYASKRAPSVLFVNIRSHHLDTY